jgi:hypothetical protein
MFPPPSAWQGKQQGASAQNIFSHPTALPHPTSFKNSSKMALKVETLASDGSELVNHSYSDSETSFELGQTWICISVLVAYEQIFLWIVIR